MAEQEILLSIGGAATRLNLSTKMVERLIAAGAIPFVQVSERIRRVPVEGLRQYAAKAAVTAGAR